MRFAEEFTLVWSTVRFFVIFFKEVGSVSYISQNTNIYKVWLSIDITWLDSSLDLVQLVGD